MNIQVSAQSGLLVIWGGDSRQKHSMGQWNVTYSEAKANIWHKKRSAEWQHVHTQMASVLKVKPLKMKH